MIIFPAKRLPSAVFGIVCALSLLALSPEARAQNGSMPAEAATDQTESGTKGTNDIDEVFATVDGMPITAGDIVVAAEDYARQLGVPPGNVPVPEILNALIDMRLVAKAAEDAGFDDDEVVQKRIAYNRDRVLHNAYLSDGAQKAITNETVKAQFDKEVADFQPQEERHLRHILVETEDEGKQIIADLEAGGDFAEIAGEKSIDPGSASNGGDLDFITRGVTVPEFEEAAFALEVGEITDMPVQTQFGWHVIKLDEKRDSSPPEFASEENRIRSELLREYVTQEIESLRASADIELIEVEKPADAEPQASGDAEATETPAQ